MDTEEKENRKNRKKDHVKMRETVKYNNTGSKESKEKKIYPSRRNI